MQTRSSADRFTSSLSLAQQRKNKQTNKQKLSTNSPDKKLTQTIGPTLGGKKPRKRKNSTFFKERIQFSLKHEKQRPQTQ